MTSGRARTRRAALLAGIPLVALLLAAVVLRLPPIADWLTARVGAELPAGMSVQRATITALPPGVRLHNLALAPAGPTLESVLCRVRVGALLAGRTEIDSIAIGGASLTIERTAEGLLQIAGSLAPLLGPAQGGTPPPAATALLALPEITITEGSVVFVDHTPSGGSETLRLTDVRLTFGGMGPGTVPLDLAARFEPAGKINGHGTIAMAAPADAGGQRAIDATLTATGIDAETLVAYLAALGPGGGTATAQGSLEASLIISGTLAALTGQGALTLQSGSVVWQDVYLTAPLSLSTRIARSSNGVTLSGGQVSIAQLAAGRIRATDVTTAFEVADDTLQLTAGSARAYGGTFTQHGSVSIADPPRFDLTLAASGVDCAGLVAAATGERPEYGCERLDTQVVARGAWTGATTAVRNAEGNGRLELRGGTIPSSSIIGALWEALLPFLHSDEKRRALTAPTKVDHLTQSFQLRDGRMETTDLSFVTDDYTVAGTGSIGLGGTLDLDTEVALTPAGVTKLLVMASLPIPGEPRPLPAIPTRITGTVGDPDVRPKVENLPLAAGSLLWRGARGAGQALKDVAGTGWRAIEQGLK